MYGNDISDTGTRRSSGITGCPYGCHVTPHHCSYITAVVRGDVAAVRAACDAGRTAGARVADVVAVHVIARPHSGVDMTIPLGRGPETSQD